MNYLLENNVGSYAEPYIENDKQRDVKMDSGGNTPKRDITKNPN